MKILAKREKAEITGSMAGSEKVRAEGEEAALFRNQIDGAAVSDALDLLDEDMLRAAMAARTKRKSSNFRWVKWCAAAACLGAVGIFAAALWSYGLQEAEHEYMEEVRSLPVEILPWEELLASVYDMADEAQGEETDGDNPDGKIEIQPVAISSLLAEVEGDGAIQQMQVLISKIPVGEYEAVYEKVQNASELLLAENIGEPVPGTEEYFLVAGHEDMQYLVRQDQEEYSLWKYQCFTSDEYPYSDVLELVYRLDKAADITKIIVSPAKMDNTDEGKRIQKEIGTHMVTDPEAIETVYEILSSMTCYGSNQWERIDYGAADAPSDGTGMSHRAVRLGRYLSLATEYGNEIDGLKYTAVSDMFYEFSGIAYSLLDEEQAQAIRRILGITE